MSFNSGNPKRFGETPAFSFATPTFSGTTFTFGEKFSARKNPFSVTQPPKTLVQPQPLPNEFKPSVDVLSEDESKCGRSESNSIYSSSNIVGSAIMSLLFFVLPSLIGFNKIHEENQERDMTDVDVLRLGQ